MSTAPASDGAAVTAGEIARWRAAGRPYQVIAAAIAEWAARQEHGTPLPQNYYFRLNASASTYTRAKQLLGERGVLEEADDGTFRVVAASP
jgi:hypothetical protein